MSLTNSKISLSIQILSWGKVGERQFSVKHRREPDPHIHNQRCPRLAPNYRRFGKFLPLINFVDSTRRQKLKNMKTFLTSTDSAVVLHVWVTGSWKQKNKQCGNLSNETVVNLSSQNVALYILTIDFFSTIRDLTNRYEQHI